MNTTTVKQVGGSHYESQYQHWDMCVDLRLDYLRSCATKYVTRSRKKNGREDLLKAVSYLEKASVCYRQDRGPGLDRYSGYEPSVQFFFAVNQLSEWEKNVILNILQSEFDGDLDKCAEMIREYVSSQTWSQADPIKVE